MNAIKAQLAATLLLASVAYAQDQPAPGAPPPAPVQAQSPNARIRGSVTAFDGHELRVTTREGKAVNVSVSADTRISVLSPLTMRDIRMGSFVGVTAVLRGPGPILEALEVHVFPESLRGTGEGHYDWDLEPGSTMTNANIEAVVSTRKGKLLTLSYKGGSQKIIVPKGVPIVTFTPADTSLLMPGTPLFVIAQQTPDGGLSALRILVGKGGLKPPM